MDLEYSITPPMSPCCEEENHDEERRDDPPRLGQSLRQDNVQCLSCIDCFSSHVKRQSAPSINKRILAGKDPSPGCYQDNTCELFGHTYVTEVALLEKATHLFSLARQCISKIQKLLGQGSNWALIDPIVSEAKRLHSRVMTFMQYIQVFIHRIFKVPTANQQPSIFSQQLVGFPSRLVAELQTLSLFNGRVGDQPLSALQSCATSTGRQESTGSLLLHINLSIQWSILQAFHILHTKLKGGLQGDAEVMTSFNDKAQELMQDLIGIATVKYNKLRCCDLNEHGPFQEGCLQDLWSSLIQMLDSRHGQFATDSFWCCFHGTLTPILEDDSSLSSSPRDQTSHLVPRNPVGLSWWLLQYVAPLYQYQVASNNKQARPIRSYWLLVEDLIKLMLSSKDTLPDEAHMQCYLKSCLVLCHIWEPRGAVLTQLWGHFHKRLNQKMVIPGQGVRGLGTICKTAHSWYDQCQERIADHAPSHNHENSFDLFLRILATQLRVMKESGGAQGWKNLQGRFYSKFHGRSMKELDETGLSRFLSLFLTFALVTDLPGSTSRMLDFLDLLPTDTLTHGKLTLIWRGLFTLCLIHEGQETDLAVVADRLVQGFNTVCIEMKNEAIDSGRKSQLWGLILSYTEATQEVFDASNKLNLSEEKLIGSGLRSLLDVASEHEMRTLLMFLQNIMARHRILYQQVLMQRSDSAESNSAMSTGGSPLMQKYKALARVLWENVYPFVKKHASTQTPPSELADVATSFTLLSADLKLHEAIKSEETRQPTPREMFEYYGLEDHKVHHSITVRYLCHLLPNQDLMERLQTALGPAQWASALIHAWIRCSLLSPQSSTPMQELTRLVFKLGEVSAIMNSRSPSNQADLAGTSHKQVMLQFIQALGHQFNSAKGLQERVQKRQLVHSYFGDLVALIQPMLRTLRSSSDLVWIYQVMGQIVKHCASILYVKGKSQAQLPGILTELILPPALFNPKKTLPQPMLASIRDTLHLFLEGLASLDLHEDEFIQRKVQEIIQQYFLRFQAKSSLISTGSSGSSTANHPIMVALHKSCSRTPHAHICTLRGIVLRGLRQHFLTYHGQQPPSHVPYTLSFIQELLQRTNHPQQVARDTVVLLPTILHYLLVCDVMPIKKSVSFLLTTMMDACKKDIPQALRGELLGALQTFLSRNLRVHQVATLRVLESVAVQHPSLVTDLIQDCSRLISECEYKRGVGADSTLRQAYCSILGHLGKEGQLVIARVKNGEKLLQE